MIGGTLVDTHVVVDVERQFAAAHIIGIRVFNAGPPVLNIVNPALAVGARIDHAAVIDQRTLVIIGVQYPRHLQLLDVVGTGGRLGAAFGSGKGRQQHRRQNGNDRDDDE